MTTTLKIPTIETERLRLRSVKPADFPAYCAFRTDPERTKYLGGVDDEARSFDRLSEIVGHWLMRGFGRFMIADKTTDEPLGVVGPYYPADWPEPEIAWSVFAKAEGRGIAFEAATASRAFAYDTLGWTTAISMIYGDNQRSISLAKRMGCTPAPDFHHPQHGVMQVWRHPAPEVLA